MADVTDPSVTGKKVITASYGVYLDTPITFVTDLHVNGLIKDVTTPQTLTGAWAVNVTSAVTLLVTTGANALTLADGETGQWKTIIMKTDWGDGTLTPTHFWSGSTITFNDAGDTALLLFQNAKWYFIAGSATVA